MEGRIHSVLATQIEDEDPLACVTLHTHAFSNRAPNVIVKALLSLSLQLTRICRDSAAEMGPHAENTNKSSSLQPSAPLDVVEGRVCPQSPRPIHQHHCRADLGSSDCPFGCAEDTAC